VSDQIIQGARVDLTDLLSLRYRRLNTSTQSVRVMGTQAGSRLSKLRGRGLDFSEVRVYQPGDDVRTIDWRVTARKNIPHTKVFREERERLTLVVVDQTQSMFFGSKVRLKSVAAAEIAAFSAWQAFHHNDRVGGMIIDNHSHIIHKPYRNVKSVARFLGDLAQANQALVRGDDHPPATHFADALLQLRRLAHNNYRIYFISDFHPLGDHWREAFRSLSQRNEVIALRVYDPLEADLPPADSYTVTDGHQRWQFHAGNNRLRTHYHARFEHDLDQFRKTCEETAVNYRLIPTHEPLSTVPGWL
jgi:uncharacterized protein (DUF58 family)